MTPRIMLNFIIVMMSLAMTSFRWPVNDGTITSTFCESRWDHFHDGIDMVSAGDAVYPVESGKLLFYWDRAIFPMENYPGGGNYKVLEHRNGIYSIYMHLENGSPAKKIYTINEPVGLMGNTGHSMKKHVHFTILDAARKTTRNPFLLLPRIDDTRAPDIHEIAFHIGDKYVIVRDRSNIRLTRHYPLLIKITDSMKGRENLGIYKLSVYLNGAQSLTEVFNDLTYSRGMLRVGGRPFEALFDRKGYYRVEGVTYREGENIVRITASDFAGNIVEKEFTFNVKLDINR